MVVKCRWPFNKNLVKGGLYYVRLNGKLDPNVVGMAEPVIYDPQANGVILYKAGCRLLQVWLLVLFEVLQISITRNCASFLQYKITFTAEIYKPNIGYLNSCC